MSDPAYPECINELYQSEVLGEQAFLALVERAQRPGQLPLRYFPAIGK